MTKKSFVVILILSVVVWYLSRIVQALMELLILKTASISPYPTSNIETGYPIALNLSQSNTSIYFYYMVNITFWFLLILGVWRIIKRPKKR
ncbi:MAG: hypothetical protein A3H17_03510 [Candidatus Levybacteria bacterium RIFCSPLOWO2_12_FULL_37_14]|nr:MAG: hypothetical protein A3H17_03510 [Candidatus Levybacteria bacterium RIFCSPLOWO2_12_FULL_37_14]